MRRREFITLLGSAAAIRPLGARAEHPLERILYFTYSAGYRHDVIPLSKAILTRLGRNSGVFEVTATEDTSEFSTENLKRYAAVMFYTTGELPMSGSQKTALLNFVRSGRGFLGVHSATDALLTNGVNNVADFLISEQQIDKLRNLDTVNRDVRLANACNNQVLLLCPV